MVRRLWLWALTACLLPIVAVHAVELAPEIDVSHYAVRLQPDFTNKSVAGHAKITFKTPHEDAAVVHFDAGNLEIDAVRENGAMLTFEKNGDRLTIHLTQASRVGDRHEVEIDYHGTPRRGVQFFPDLSQVYAGFSTSEWMPCINSPSDRATLDLTLVLKPDLKVVANGRRVSERTLDDGRHASRWSLAEPMPSYLYGFAAGRFREVFDRSEKPVLRFLAPMTFSDADLRRIFALTRDMIVFYEAKSGLSYPAPIYTQVLLNGNPAQELAGFTELREAYGTQVLADNTKVWLAAHELQHQWWGNSVTNKSWSHFWLNEGIGTFMTDAYIEYRFGHAAYMTDINAYRANYEKLRDAGEDKPLVFPSWDHPTPDDRSLVYDKGAYVVHLLRMKLGEDAFWTGIRHYTEKFWGKSVTTRDFKEAMEQASGQNLDTFFAHWVYLTDR